MTRWFGLGCAALLVANLSGAQEAPVAPGEPVPVEAPVAEPAAGPRTWVLDPARSWIYVLIFNDWERWTAVTGHDHGVKATTFDGTVVWDVNDASKCSVTIHFPVSALEIDPPGMREHARLPPEGAVGDGGKATATGNMFGRSQLDANAFPEIRFQSTSCSGTTGLVDVSGTLTVHGVGKALTVPMQVEVSDARFAAKGVFTLTHADFGMKPFTYGPGTPKNLEKLEFHVDVVSK